MHWSSWSLSLVVSLWTTWMRATTFLTSASTACRFLLMASASFMASRALVSFSLRNASKRIASCVRGSAVGCRTSGHMGARGLTAHLLQHAFALPQGLVLDPGALVQLQQCETVGEA